MKFKLPSTFSVLAALGIVGAAWEIYTICDKTRGNTFSATIKKLGVAQPFIPLMCGALSKHLWCDEAPRRAFEMGWVAGDFWPLTDKEDVTEPEKQND